MTNHLIPGHRVEPSLSIDNPRFVYVPAAKTTADTIRATFDREIARLNALRAQAPEVSADQQKVRELRRAK